MPYDHNRSRGSGKKNASGTNDNRTDEFGSRRGSNQRTMTQKRAEQRFDCEFESAGEIRKVMRLEARFGQRVHNWIDEGMPIEAMGNPEQMEAYRTRKGTPVPWNIEQFNQDSERRNTSKILRRRQEGPDGDTQVPDSVRDVLSSPGHSLEPSIQRAMEDKMGDSFGDVELHTGPTAAQACEEINARAFTVGNHIAFNRGEYDPSSAQGQHVLAHELAHVRQQTGGAVSMLPQADVQLEIDPDPKLEEEAEETAQRVMADGKLDVQRLEKSTVYVQRAMGAEQYEGGSMPAAEAGGGQSGGASEGGVGLVPDEVTAEPEALAEEVKQLKLNQAKLFSAVNDDRGLVDELGEATGKGVVGGTVGLLAGVATGNPIVGALAGGAAADVGKALYGKVHDKGSDKLADLSESGLEQLDAIIDQKVRERLPDRWTGEGDSQDVVESQR